MLYFNAETRKWTQLPWDVDLLYEEFQRWGPLGVQNASRLEQFRLAFEHESIEIEYQARMRELEDLLFNEDQAWQVVERYARYVEPFAAVDRAMWGLPSANKLDSPWLLLSIPRAISWWRRRLGSARTNLTEF